MLERPCIGCAWRGRQERRRWRQRRCCCLWWLPSALVVALGALPGTGASLTIQRGPIAPATADPPTTNAENERLAAEWVITGPATADAAAFGALRIDVPCQVLVRLAAPATTFAASSPKTQEPLAGVRVSGSAAGIIDAVVVTDLASQDDEPMTTAPVNATACDGMDVRMLARGPATPRRWSHIAWLHIDIVVHRPLRRLVHEGPGDLIVGDQVLAAASTASTTADGDERSGTTELVLAGGSGDVFITAGTSQFERDALVVRHAAHGDVSLSVAALHLGALTVDLAGSGDLTLVATEGIAVDGLTTIHGTGAGDLCIGALDKTMTLHQLHVAQSGSGDLNVADPLPSGGTCEQATITSTGPGDINLGAIRCDDVDVQLLDGGDGSIVVQADRSLTGQRAGAGDIYYTGALPQFIAEGKHADGRMKPIASAYHGDGPHKQCLIPMVPSREMSPVVDEREPGDGGQRGAASVHTAKIEWKFRLGPLFLVSFAFFYVCRECIRRWRRHQRQRWHQREREPLLRRTESPVYV